MKTIAWLLVVSVSLQFTACASLSAEGEKVVLTQDKARVKDCKLVGRVQATPPYALPSDWKKKVRNQAGALGANFVLADTEGLKSTVDGEAYLCP